MDLLVVDCEYTSPTSLFEKEVSDSLQRSGPREFDESEDMFEREFEDTEFE